MMEFSNNFKSKTSKEKIFKKYMWILVVFIAILIISILSIRYGSVRYSVNEILRGIFIRDNKKITSVIFDIRLPRLLISIFIGANLSIAGVLLQAVMANPLADPGVTGVSSGASLMAVIILIIFPQFSSFLPIVAFIGAIITCVLVYTLAFQGGIKPMRIVLAGIAINTLLSSVTSLLFMLFSDQIQGVVSRLNGSLANKTWSTLNIIIPYSLIGLALSIFCAKGCNVLALGDDMAKSLGINVTLVRIFVSAEACFLAAISVSNVGLIGFVGLIVPHISRMIIGYDHKFLIPFSALLGAAVLSLADLLSRALFAPIEIPVGIVMSTLGVPFFLYIMRKGGKKIGE